MELSVILGLPVLITGVGSVIYAILVFIYKHGNSSSKDWNYFLKKYWARRAIRSWKKSNLDKIKHDWEADSPQPLQDDTCDNMTFFGSNNNSSSLFISFTRRTFGISNVILILTLEDGSIYELPNHPNTTFSSASADSWSAGGLSFTLLEAFKRWRIVYNGLLSTTNSKGEQELKHVRFNFIWILASHPISFPADCSDSLLAEAIALKPWKNPYWMKDVTELQRKGYDQYGCLMGSLIVGDAVEPQTIGLHGLRKRRWQFDVAELDKYVSLFGTASDGSVYIIEIETTKRSTRLVHGNVRKPNGVIAPVESVNMNYQLICDSTVPPKAFTVKIKTNSNSLVVYIMLETKLAKKYFGLKPEPWKCDLIPYQNGINGSQGTGYLQISQITEDDFSTDSSTGQNVKRLSWLQLRDTLGEKIPICASFKARMSSCPAVVGGKAASLSLLSSVLSNQFSVPNGFCLTSRALEAQMEHNADLVQAVRAIENANVGNSESNIKECCQRATDLFEKTPICEIVKEFISFYYEELCKKEEDLQNDKIFVAVRSSGIGEDSEDLSAAGQNATILGCKTLDEVLVGVQKCWASLFTFQSVEYRRQYGQVADCGMGVVIQVMVESEAAGVMFTRHPNNGNPRELLITSSYGIGESVVSGHVEPDTIIVDVDKLKIKSYDVGKKGQKIVLDHTGNQQTLSVTMNEEDGKKGSISEEHCLALAELGLEQEALWGSPRDIEWAIVKGKIYLLQARPITSLNSWTEFELLHEYDTAVMSGDDIMTFSNTGEVFPGTVSHLSQSIIGDLLSSSISNRIRKSKHVIEPWFAMVVTHNRLGLNLLNTILYHPQEKVSVRSKTMDIAICGHELIDNKMIAVAGHRFGFGKFNELVSIAQVVSYLWNSKKYTKRCEEICKEFKIDLGQCNSALEMLEEIKKKLPSLQTTGECHSVTTSASVFSQIVFLSTILGTNTDFTAENYQDIGTILSSCSDVVSAEIPEILKNISLTIKQSGKGDAFSKQKPEESIEWLKVNIPKAHTMVIEFLEKHGHRSIKEFDLMEEPWGLNPIPLIKTLQVSYDIPHKDNPPTATVNELIAQLVTPINNVTKTVLKYVIPMCQISVTRREATKAAYITMVHRLRLAFIELEKQMIKEWRIPERKLIFMLTLTELERLLKTRDPGLIAKSKLRKRYNTKWNKLQFNELNWGFPQPIVEDKNKFLSMSESSDVAIRGTPVCSGEIIARACVIRDISKIDELQHGDILVTHSTDIGWSPYFPMLGGVVTELGGLISHGAVVAREYGLPCIVGAQGATSAFKTGDTVLLHASNGVLKRVVI